MQVVRFNVFVLREWRPAGKIRGKRVLGHSGYLGEKICNVPWNQLTSSLPVPLRTEVKPDRSLWHRLCQLLHLRLFRGDRCFSDRCIRVTKGCRRLTLCFVFIFSFPPCLIPQTVQAADSVMEVFLNSADCECAWEFPFTQILLGKLCRLLKE